MGERSVVMSVSVCVCVCLSYRDHIFGTMGPIFTKFFLCWRTEKLCTPGFMDDVIFAHKPRLIDVAAQLGHGYKTCAVIPVAGQRTHGTTFQALKVTSQVATPGAESAVAPTSLVHRIRQKSSSDALGHFVCR